MEPVPFYFLDSTEEPVPFHALDALTYSGLCHGPPLWSGGMTDNAGRRVQRRRGVPLPPGARAVDRSSRWGNPYVWRTADLRPGRFLVADRAEAIARYAADLRARPDLDAFLAPLRGMDLACYCPLSEPCHADALLDALTGQNAGTPPSWPVVAGR